MIPTGTYDSYPDPVVQTNGVLHAQRDTANIFDQTDRNKAVMRLFNIVLRTAV